QPDAIIPEARTALRRVDSRVAMGDVRTMEQIVEDLLRQQRTSAVVIAGLALGALLLAAMGLFGVVSSSVTRRRNEMAVRLALGADHGRVMRLVLGEGALLVGIGVVIGVPGIYAAGRLIRGVLVGLTPSIGARASSSISVSAPARLPHGAWRDRPAHGSWAWTWTLKCWRWRRDGFRTRRPSRAGISCAPPCRAPTPRSRRSRCITYARAQPSCGSTGGCGTRLRPAARSSRPIAIRTPGDRPPPR